jgi:hypothetical protein
LNEPLTISRHQKFRQQLDINPACDFLWLLIKYWRIWHGRGTKSLFAINFFFLPVANL